jgi:hypothetical protein
MTKSTETEIELLKAYREQMSQDIHDLKSDVKQIKDFLMGDEPKVVTAHEFEKYKATQAFGKVVFGVFVSVITAFITYEILRQLK